MNNSLIYEFIGLTNEIVKYGNLYANSFMYPRVLFLSWKSDDLKPS